MDLNELQALWDWTLENSTNTDLKAKVKGIQVKTLKFSFCFGIHLAELILAHTDNQGCTLQATQMTAVDGQKIAQM